MSFITFIGAALIAVGLVCVVLSPPKEKLVHVTQPPFTAPFAYGTTVAISTEDGMITAATVPGGGPGKILEWDKEFLLYRWVDAEQPP